MPRPRREPPPTIGRIDRVDTREIHHVAMAVSSLDEAVETYRRLGAEVELRGRLGDQGIEAAYLRLGESRVELVAPLDDDTPVGRFLASRGPGVHHVAYEVGSVPAAIEALISEGATMVDEEPRRGLDGHEVAFVHPGSVHGVLVEVVAHG